MTGKWAASADFVAVSAAGERSPLVVRIGVPEQSPSGTWRCGASLAGLYDGLSHMEGEDALQAVGLAWNLLGRLLRDFESTGGHLEYHTGERVPLEAYFDSDAQGSVG